MVPAGFVDVLTKDVGVCLVAIVAGSVSLGGALAQAAYFEENAGYGVSKGVNGVVGHICVLSLMVRIKY